MPFKLARLSSSKFQKFLLVPGPLIRAMLPFVGVAAKIQREKSRLKVIRAGRSSLHHE